MNGLYTQPTYWVTASDTTTLHASDGQGGTTATFAGSFLEGEAVIITHIVVAGSSSGTGSGTWSIRVTNDAFVANDTPLYLGFFSKAGSAPGSFPVGIYVPAGGWGVQTDAATSDVNIHFIPAN